MKLLVLPVVIAFLFIGSMFTSMPVAAAATEIGYFLTTAPPSYNATYWTVYPRYATSHVEADAVKVANDASYLDLYTTSSSALKWVKANDFRDNDSWIDPGNSTFATPVGYLPPDDATIVSVSILMWFTAYRPNAILHFSVDDESTYYTSGLYAESMSGLLGIVQWNVTSLIAWTPQLLNTSDVWVKLQAYPDAGVHYYLDYLGFFIQWYGEYEGGGDGGGDYPDWYDPEPDEGATFDFDLLFTSGGIIGIMGLVGILGMIALPAYAIVCYKNDHESKLVLFAKLLVTFMFCLTLFMVSINA